ncbi:hypothetical protein BDV28DRAFT_148312 [Aspergillus coremiiformis]|uniref:Uncharacterized protein n=1 Tax=Aspergillus coremiiformis TaxID=138285 RepID=A0A5N6Z679_9EURO|nr:hypothetical protein BDV28DRAFT_148312 [Aspergillus coremiiformis]
MKTGIIPILITVFLSASQTVAVPPPDNEGGQRTFRFIQVDPGARRESNNDRQVSQSLANFPDYRTLSTVTSNRRYIYGSCRKARNARTAMCKVREGGKRWNVKCADRCTQGGCIIDTKRDTEVGHPPIAKCSDIPPRGANENAPSGSSPR